jgi:hypothetical protein
VLKVGTQTWASLRDTPEMGTVLAAIPPAVPPEEAIKRIFIGGWRVGPIVNEVGWSQVIEAFYTSDGKVNGVVTTEVPPLGDGMTMPAQSSRVSGTWSIKALTKDRFTLTLSIDGRVSTSTLRIVNQNELYNETGNFAVYRIQ